MTQTPTQSSQVLTTPEGKLVIDSRFATLGVSAGYAPPPLLKSGMILLSWSGAGKSTFVRSIPDSITVEFGDNSGAVIGSHSHRVQVRSWAEWDNLRALLLTSKATGTCPYTIVSFDTADEWFDILAEKVIADNNTRSKFQATSIGQVGAEGKGYAEVGNLMEKELRALLYAGLGWVLTGHLREKEITEQFGSETRKVTKIRPVLTQSSFTPVVRLAGIRAQIIDVPRQAMERRILPNGKVVEVPVPKLILDKWLRLTANQAGDEIKRRLHFLPDLLPFPLVGAWEALGRAYDEAVAKGAAEDTRLRTQGAKL